MPYAVKRDETDSSLVWMHFWGNLTWQEYREAFAALVAEVRAIPGRAAAILVAETAVPEGNAIPYFRQALRRLAELNNLGLFVSVNPTAGLVARAMVTALTRLDIPRIAGRVPFVTTRDDARRVIAVDRARTRPVPPAGRS